MPGGLRKALTHPTAAVEIWGSNVIRQLSEKPVLQFLFVLCCITSGCHKTTSSPSPVQWHHETRFVTERLLKLGHDDVIRACWKEEPVGTNSSRDVGPTDYRYVGFVELTDRAAEDISSSYTWQSSAVPSQLVKELQECISEVPDGTLESNELDSKLISNGKAGRLWYSKDANVIVFELTTM